MYNQKNCRKKEHLFASESIWMNLSSRIIILSKTLKIKDLQRRHCLRGINTKYYFIRSTTYNKHIGRRQYARTAKMLLLKIVLVMLKSDDLCSKLKVFNIKLTALLVLVHILRIHSPSLLPELENVYTNWHNILQYLVHEYWIPLTVVKKHVNEKLNFFCF